MKTLLHLIFILPGRIIAYFSYLFPGRGQVWTSARRKDNVAAHIIFSLLFWFIVVIWGAPIIGGIVGASTSNVDRFLTTPAAITSDNSNQSRSTGGAYEFSAPNVADMYLGSGHKK